MQRSFIDWLCGNEPFAFESDFGLAAIRSAILK
jgi:hypothetical protein